jgi:hypothetical protein
MVAVAGTHNSRDLAMVLIRSRRQRIEIRRNPNRKSLRLSARIDAGRAGVLPCTIDEFTENGARITLKKVMRLPRHFILLLTERDYPRRECRMLWHDGLEAGVEFPKKTQR